jgi:hypothetical protein
MKAEPRPRTCISDVKGRSEAAKAEVVRKSVGLYRPCGFDSRRPESFFVENCCTNCSENGSDLSCGTVVINDTVNVPKSRLSFVGVSGRQG